MKILILAAAGMLGPHMRCLLADRSEIWGTFYNNVADYECCDPLSVESAIETDCVFLESRGNYTEINSPDPVDLYGPIKLSVNSCARAFGTIVAYLSVCYLLHGSFSPHYPAGENL